MELKSIKKSCSESLIISLLKDGPMHGYEMGKEIEGRSSGYFSFAHSTLYPVLHKLEKKGLIRGEWHQSDNERPRKYYALTAAGERYHADDREQWRDFFLAMTRLMPELAKEVGS